MSRLSFAGALLAMALLAAACATTGTAAPTPAPPPEPAATTTMAAQAPTTSTTTAPQPDHAVLFTPEARVAGDRAELGVTFPNGATGTLTYPADLPLAGYGVHPLVEAWERPNVHEFGPARRLLALRGTPGEVAAWLAGGDAPEVTAEFVAHDGSPVPKYQLDDGRAFLALAAGGWTVLIPDGVPLPVADDAQRAVWARSIVAEETADGFLTVDVVPPLESNPAWQRSRLLVGGPTADVVELLLDGTPRHEQTEGIEISAGGCTPWPEDDDEPRFWCQADAQVSFAVAGDSYPPHPEEWLAIEDAELPVAIVDPAWVTEQEMLAHDDGHDHAWVSARFFPPGVLIPEDMNPAGLPVRWRIVSGLAPEAAPDARLAAALAAMEGGAPPGLGHPLRGVPLAPRSVTVDGGTVTLDFEPGFAVTNQTGSSGGAAYAFQLFRTVGDYLPDRQVEILIAGECAAVFHDSLYCDGEL